MSRWNKFRSPQFRIYHLFIVVFASAIVAWITTLLPGPPPNESMLAEKDREIVNRLRGTGLNIAMRHMCGMGDLAGFDIERCPDRIYHVTSLYIQHRDPAPFIQVILSFPELNELMIGDVDSTKSVTIQRADLNTNFVRNILADNKRMNRS